MTKRCLIAALLIFATICVQAAKLREFKFGDPSDEEWKMTTCANDSSAEAIMLLNLRDVGFRIVPGDGFKIVTTKRIRMKVLKEDGKQFANVSFTIFSNKKSNGVHETLHGLKAVAINMVDGKPVKTKMKGDMVFKEQLGKSYELVKFTIPQVNVGTIFEYEYTIMGDNFWNMSDWYAQQGVPVMYARYTSLVPEWLNFNYQTQGHDYLKGIYGDGLPDRKDVVKAVSRAYIWEASNIPALKSDGYLWCPSDYMVKVSAELTSTSFPGDQIRDYGQTWERIDEIMFEEGWFGGRIGKKTPFSDELKQKGIAEIADKEQRAIQTISLLQSHVKWNKEYSLIPQSMSKTAKDATGNNADINILLVNMLREVGIDANPLVMRRRDLGMLPFTYPSTDKLTTFIVAIPLSAKKTVYADASCEKGYLNAFSPLLYPMRARIITKDNVEEKWVDLQKVAMAVTSNNIVASIDAEGNMSGEVKAVHRGQSAYQYRTSYSDAKDEKEFISKKEKSDNITISDYSATGKEGFGKETVETYKFTRTGDASDDHIYINPIVMRIVNKNPFTDAKRLKPIEFPFMQTENTVYNITIPDGWEVEELPKSISIATPGREMIARIACAADGNEIQLQTIFKINATFYPVEVYDIVKEMFGTLADRCDDMIVLKKK